METDTNTTQIPARCQQPIVRPPSADAIRYADYILNHYSRDSHADKLCLARDLEQHGWVSGRANAPHQATASDGLPLT